MFDITIFKITENLKPELTRQMRSENFFIWDFFTGLAKELDHGCYKIVVEESPRKMRQIIYRPNKLLIKEKKGTKTYYMFL